MPEIKHCICLKIWPENQSNYTLALFKTSSHRTGLILNRLLKYDTLPQTVTCNMKKTGARFEVVHNRSKEFADHGQLCNFTTHLFTTASVTHMN